MPMPSDGIYSPGSMVNTIPGRSGWFGSKSCTSMPIMCDSPCTPVLMGPTEADALYQKDDFEKAFGKTCFKTGYEDPRYPGVLVSGDDNLYCCCPTVNDRSILHGDESLVKGPPFNDHAGIPNERDVGVPVGPYVIER